MFSSFDGDRGFTLIELMIVVIVVGILAAVAIPMYQVIPERSRATEAVAGLDAIRSSLRVYYGEHGSYSNASFVDGERVTVGGILGVKDVDLSGRYFSSESYTFLGDASANSFVIECDGAASTAPKAADASNIVVTIDQAGEIDTSW